MDVQTCNCRIASNLYDRISDLEARLQEALARNDRLELEIASAILRADEREHDAANERELRQSLEEAIEDNSIVTTLERIIARHATEVQAERARLDAAVLRHDEEMKAERARLDAATLRHEQTILDLVAKHRDQVSKRIDQVVDQNKALYSRIATTIQDLWAARGTTRPSHEKEHWFLLAREDDDEPDGGKIVTFKIHSGQRAYIDRIGRSKDVVLASPAANGVDIRQSTKKRMRELLEDETGIKISALRFSCSDAEKLDGFFAHLLESIDVAVTAPTTDVINLLVRESGKNLREAFDLDVLFNSTAVAA